MRTHFLVVGCAITLVALLSLASAGTSPAKADGPAPVFNLLGDYSTGLGEASAETVAYDAGLLFVTNSTDNSIDIVDISNPALPQRIKRVPLAAYGTGPNSVDAYRGIVAVEPFDYVPDGPGAAARAIGYVKGILEALD